MFENIRYEYSVKTCSNQDPENLEDLLNTMAAEGWNLYTINEVEAPTSGFQYSCIFQREFDENKSKKIEIADIQDFKSKMEKMLHPSDKPYEECMEIQSQINEHQQKVNKIKLQLDKTSNDIDRDRLNREMSNYLAEINSLKSKLAEVISPNRMYENIYQDKLIILLSYELTDLVNTEKGGELISQTVKLRQKISENLGYVIPAIKFAVNEELGDNEYEIKVRGAKILSGCVYPGFSRYYAGQSNINRKPKNAIEEYDFIKQKKTFWIEKSKTKNFWEKGLSPAEVISKNLEYVVCKCADQLLDYSDINNYIEIVGTQNFFLVETLVADHLTIGEIRAILAKLIEEKISIKDIVYIFEKLTDFAQILKTSIEGEEVTILDIKEMLKNLRKALKMQICNSIADSNGTIYAITLSDKTAIMLEKELQKDKLYYDNPKIKSFINKILKIIETNELETKHTALVAPNSIRRKMFRLIENFIPELAVIAKTELSGEFSIDIIEEIGSKNGEE
ncbi:MAG: FHIPEP family type III secretion protein [Candidatus Gastranaerophilales bacterium]|nr:FHIPEP family type III secretion protein [Candidatus Gastranaerophilales bacterium]